MSTLRIHSGMRHVLTVLLAITLLAASLPLHACACGCADSVSSQPQPTTQCAHCGETAPEPACPSARPCHCDDCDGQLAMLPIQKVAVASSDHAGRYVALAADRGICGSIVCVSVDNRTPHAERPPLGSARSIPILLGHLLL